MKCNVLKYSVFLFFMFSCTQIKAQGPENDLKVHDLSGKVKSCKQSTFEAVDKFGVVQKGKRIDEHFESNQLLYFNEIGKCVTTFDYDSSGKLESKAVCIYDSGSKLIEETVYASSGQLTEKYICTYSQGRISQLAKYNSAGGLLKKTLYEYNSMNQKIESREYLVDGTKGEKETWKYDKQGVLAEYSNYEGSGELSYTIKFDKNGNALESNFIKLGFKFFNRYDANGNKIESTQKDVNYEIKHFYTYDDKRNLIKEKQVSNGDTDLTTYEYTYDQHQNWIKRIEYLNGIPQYLVEREIEYY